MDGSPQGSNRLHYGSEAASTRLAELGVRRSSGTLDQLRSKGSGPAFIRVGARQIAYYDADLRKWAAENLRRATSTSDAGKQLPEEQAPTVAPMGHDLTAEQRHEVVQLCMLADRPELADGFIDAGAPPPDVRRQLIEMKRGGQGTAA